MVNENLKIQHKTCCMHKIVRAEIDNLSDSFTAKEMFILNCRDCDILHFFPDDHLQLR